MAKVKKDVLPKELLSIERRNEKNRSFQETWIDIAHLMQVSPWELGVKMRRKAFSFADCYNIPDIMTYSSTEKKIHMEPCEAEKYINLFYTGSVIYTEAPNCWTGCLLYADKNGQIWINQINFVITIEGRLRGPSWTQRRAMNGKYSVGEWKPLNKIIAPTRITVINPDNEVADRLNPYLKKHICEQQKKPALNDEQKTVRNLFFVFPEVEQLQKAGYSFFESKFYFITEKDEVKLNRLIKDGKNMKEIFKIPPFAHKALKDCECLETWDIIRKMIKTKKICDAEEIELILRRVDRTCLNKINTILNRKYKGKPIFTVKSFFAYLDRIDRFEAIDSIEGIDLLKDYLNMCEHLNVKPRIDSDSLKREHDVTARIYRAKKDEAVAAAFKDRCDNLKNYNYEEDIFFIRAFRDYDDLVDESNQQRNCVLSYARDVVNKRSKIFTMREKKFPEKSLITVELSNDDERIKQAYLAYNRPVKNEAQKAFLKRWIKEVKRRKGEKLWNARMLESYTSTL